MFYLVEIPFPYWLPLLHVHPRIRIMKDSTSLCETDRLIPLSGYLEYDKDHRCIFRNTRESIAILANKVLFAQFMMAEFPSSIPKVVYYEYGPAAAYFTSSDMMEERCIIKRALSHGAKGSRLVCGKKNIQSACTENVILSEYIVHEYFYIGHFLFRGGVMKKKLYFGKKTSGPDHISRGVSRDFDVLGSEIGVDDGIFTEILHRLSYEGFVCVDFVIREGVIIIFEFNPRLNGNLIIQPYLLYQFFHAAISTDESSR